MKKIEKSIQTLTAKVANIESEEDKKKAEAAKKATEEEEKKKAEEAKKAKKGNEDITEEKKKELEAKKAQEEDEKKEKEMSAKIAAEVAEKLPLIEKFVAAKTQVSGLDETAQQKLRTEMLSASLDEVKKQWSTVEPFVAAIPMNQKQNDNAQSNIGYFPQPNQFVASSSNLDEMSTEELMKEAGIDA